MQLLQTYEKRKYRQPKKRKMKKGEVQFSGRTLAEKRSSKKKDDEKEVDNAVQDILDLISYSNLTSI